MQFNFKFFFFLFYLFYSRTFKAYLRDKKKSKTFEGRLLLKVRKQNSQAGLFIYLFRVFFKIFTKKMYTKTYLFYYLIKYFFIRGLYWFWYLFIIQILKKFIKNLYKNLSFFYFLKLKQFFVKLKCTFIPILLENINIYPNFFSTLHGFFALLFFRWKFYRKFTLNQTVWPFIRDLQQFNQQYIRGVFVKGSGRFTRKQRADLKLYFYGRVKFSTYNYNILYSYLPIITRYGTCGLKIWLSFNKNNFFRVYNMAYKIKLL